MSINSTLEWTAPAVAFEKNPTNEKPLFTAAGLAAGVQILCILGGIAVIIALGPEPETPAEYFAVLQDDRLAGLLRMDFFNLVNVALFTVTSFAVFAALRGKQALYAALAAAFTFLGVALSLSSHIGLSMLALSDAHAAAATAAEKSQLLAAGQAVIASGWWKSNAGFWSGLFLQGSVVLYSLLMLRSRRFSRATALTGLVGNGLDFIHVLLALAAPGPATVLLYLAAPFYLAWYPLLARDFFRLRRGFRKEE